MSKKNKKNKVSIPTNSTNNHVSINIDYEKLSEAIIKAQDSINKAKEYSESKGDKKPSILTAIKLIVTGKSNTNDRMTVGLMAIPLSILFKILSIASIAGTIASVRSLILYIINTSWNSWSEIISNITSITLYGFFIITLPLFFLLLWGASNEMDKSKDKHFVTAVFSGMVSFVALIISLIALNK